MDKMTSNKIQNDVSVADEESRKGGWAVEQSKCCLSGIAIYLCAFHSDMLVMEEAVVFATNKLYSTIGSL